MARQQLNKGERIQYSCGHWLVAGSFGIQDVSDIPAKLCGMCQRRITDAAPQLLEALKEAEVYLEDGALNTALDIIRAAIELTVVNRDAVQ
jgi:hypothetical protein